MTDVGIYVDQIEDIRKAWPTIFGAAKPQDPNGGGATNPENTSIDFSGGDLFNKQKRAKRGLLVN